VSADAAGLVDRVRAGGLLAPGAPVVVLLSGGRDSVCLLAVATEIAGAGAVRALHVHHGLRGAEADGDAAACAALCARLGVPLAVERATPPAGGNLQDWARGTRYAAGERAAAAHGARLATGHTATDQAETVLYRLAASPGRRALLGMPDERGPLVRPLLRAGVTREETAAWCAARRLPWREDATNASDRYARGRVRETLVPALRSLHPAAERNVLRTARLLAEEGEVLDDLVATVLGGRAEITLGHLRALPPALARLVVRRLAEDATGSLCARAPARLGDVLALGDGPAALDVGDGARAIVEDGTLRFTRTPARPARPLPSSAR
jgi:tRNA(Ile)-lysidine synthase